MQAHSRLASVPMMKRSRASAAASSEKRPMPLTATTIGDRLGISGDDRDRDGEPLEVADGGAAAQHLADGGIGDGLTLDRRRLEHDAAVVAVGDAAVRGDAEDVTRDGVSAEHRERDADAARSPGR